MRVIRRALTLALALACAAPALAEAPGVSLRPEPRPSGTERAVARAMTVMLPGRVVAVSPRPLPRPDLARIVARNVASARPARVVLASSGAAVRMSPRPLSRPQDLGRRGVIRAATVRTRPAEPRVGDREGGICGSRAIRGQAIPPIAGRVRGCGVPNPVKVTSVGGVRLTQAAIMDCNTARALKTWVDDAVKPEVGRLGGGVEALKVAAHYVCRTRNHRPGAKISEHGKGKAIDISAIVLRNGVELTVLKGWRDRIQGRILRRLHSRACGPFGTVLGPESDRFHQDHFHFDTASHRGGPYCR